MLTSRAGVFAGIGYMVLATAFFGVLDTAAKYVAISVAVLMAISVRYLVQAILSALVLVPVHGRALLVLRHPWLQMLRGALFAVTTTAALLALQHMPVGEFAAIIMLTPMLVTVLAVRVLKETVSPWHWVFVAGGLLGALVIIRPGADTGPGWWALSALACVAFSTAFQLLSSHLGRHENPAATHMCTVGFCAGLGILGLPWTWTDVASPWLWAMMVLTGVAGAAGHFILALAYQRAPVSTLMPYMYCQIGFATLGGWWAFGHAPDRWAWIGMALIATCGLCSAWLTAHDRRAAALLPET